MGDVSGLEIFSSDFYWRIEWLYEIEILFRSDSFWIVFS